MTLAKEFLELFKGSDLAHVTFEAKSTNDKGKREGAVFIKRGTATEELWERHLKGGTGLGIIPINSKNECYWGAIDIDDYTIDHKSLVHKIRAQGLQLVVGRSKSGGAHLWLFFNAPIPAAEMRKILLEMAARLGLAKAEIFPKQEEILVERGDTGNGLNMPYHNDTTNMRYGFNDAGEALTAAEFLPYAKQFVRSPVEPLPWAASARSQDDTLLEAPPCLQHLCSLGFTPGSRANALFNMGVYARKRYEEGWQEKVEEYNNRYMDPPLEQGEVAAVIGSLEKKDYFYKCNDQPIVSHCDKEACKLRKYGVGTNVPSYDMNSLTKIEGDPPIWIMTVDGKRLELPTNALVAQNAFIKACVEQINKHPRTISQVAWQNKIQGLLDGVTIVPASQDATLEAEFRDMLLQFCMERAKGDSLEDINQGISVWTQDSVFLHVRDFKKHLTVNDFKAYSSNKITMALKELGGEQETHAIRGRPVLLWRFPKTFFEEETGVIDLPALAAERDIL